MEEQHHLNHVHRQGSSSSKNNNNSSNNATSCARQSSSRWTPTTDQIRILKELYYNNGVRSPTADEIQKISVRLRQYGKIEGKNVFYWFQNHKARERQKKRLFPASSAAAAAPTTTSHFYPPQAHSNNNMMPPPIIHHMPSVHSNSLSKKYHNPINIPSGICSASSSPQTFGVGMAHQIGSYGSGSSVAMVMEKKFTDCSISAEGSRASSLRPNFGWVEEKNPNFNPYIQNNFVGYYYDENQDVGEDDDEQEGLETLPLFPVHAENVNGFCNNHHQSMPENDRYYSGWFCSGDGYGGSRASLELSLGSYGGRDYSA